MIVWTVLGVVTGLSVPHIYNWQCFHIGKENRKRSIVAEGCYIIIVYGEHYPIRRSKHEEHHVIKRV